ncbi:filamentous hemagglutinin N-terminal domain-containing protein [Leptotrichia hofstadii]|uniref:Putative septum site-determining protein MinC n=1 Tax=Leptotrichia hofstadii F0254 TaxID=634994 RepID=C9N203_9FUSO|nr:filamentous hemagglutinin N-terminal domain-containing protein [Leptotrichia hofstadii]EEX73088.1 putative septum site-determining protein MinC [Leptotrichia hofstadii F0254]
MKEKSKILRKLTAALLLNVFSFNILANGLQVDPNSRYNTSLDRAQNGVPVVNISTPNGRGVSINEFLEYNVGREGQVLNNADNIGRSHLAGIINANPNLGPNQAANLILLQVNGANRSQIEGYIEALSRQKVNVVLSNENGIYLNGAGTINIKNFIPTTGKVKLKDGDVIGIDVEKGRVVIGANGFDATNTDYVNVIAKAMELQGNLVGNKVDVTLGENTVDSSGTVTSKNGINSVAIDASNLGSMYAGQIKIVSTDKGAGVNSNGLIYSRDTKLEITADGKINVAKIKGNGIEINGTEYAQSELASSDKGININAAKIKLDGETQANEDINLNGNVENKSNIYTGGNLNTADMISSGNINVSGNITAGNFKNSLATVLSGGNFNVRNLDNSGNIQVSGITDINGKFDNTGALTSVKRISVSGNIGSTGKILTNEDLTAKNTVTSGAIAAKNLRVDNLTNDGKISTNGELTAKDVKNTGEILSSGKISGNSFVTSGKVQTNETLDINGFLDNSGTVGAAKDISVADNVLNSGEILTNGDFASRNMDTSGTVVSNNLRTGNLKNDGKIVANKDLTAKKVESAGDITVVGKIMADSLKSSGSLRTNEALDINGDFGNDGTIETPKDVTVAGDISNTGKIIAGGNLSGRNAVSAGVIASRNINVDDLKNDGKVTAGENITAKKVTNTGDIAAVGTVSSDDMSTSGTVKANKSITVAGKLENDGTVETAEDVKVSGNIRNTGRIALNGDLTGKDTVTSGTIASRNVKVDNLSNDGVIVANENLNAKNVSNTGDIVAVGTVSSDDLVTSGNVRSNGEITVAGRLENGGAVETAKNISVAGNIKNDGRIAANDDLAGKNTENNGNIYVKNLEVNSLRNTGKVEGVDLKTDDITNSGDITAIGKISGGNIDNSGKLLANDTIDAKNIKNSTSSSKIAAGKGITGVRIENSGTFATNGDIKATGSLVNNGTVDGKGIDIAGADFVNSGKINADNIRANVSNTKNDGFIYSGNDVDLTTNTLTNTKEIMAVSNINAANAIVSNSGKIASNNRVLLDGSAIANTGEILSGEIFMRNARKFDNAGTIRGNNVELGVNQDINLAGNLHGQQRLVISGNNITNNGSTTGTGLIEISSNDFTNNKELASDTVIVNGRGEIVNNNMITGNNGKISGRNITNNDLIAFENYLEMNAQGKVQNNKGKAVYGGKALAIRANEIMNDEAEILGGNMDLNAAKITNNVATIQSTGNIVITSSDFQNIGRVKGLGNYEKYFETWDGLKITEQEIRNEWAIHDGYDWGHGKYKDAIDDQKVEFEKFVTKNRNSRFKSYLLTKHEDFFRSILGKDLGYGDEFKTGTAQFPAEELRERLKSNADTEYGKVLAGGNITVNSGNFKNKDSIVSGGGLVNVNATNFENSVTIDASNPIRLRKGYEYLELNVEERGHGYDMTAFHDRQIDTRNFLTGYAAGQPAVIEGAAVRINAPNIIRSPFEDANGEELENGGATGRELISSNSIGIKKGTGSVNGAVQVAGNASLSKLTGSFSGNSQVNGSPNLNSQVSGTFDNVVEIEGNNAGIKDIKSTGVISVNPVLASAMFKANMNPASKYVMETRSSYINLSDYYGSDYFLERVGYSEVWDRARRLGDAYYENQLLTRSIAEKLGTAFINGKSNKKLIQAMMDNASAEGKRLGLKAGQELTQEQINSLNEDIIWYVTKNVNGIEVLAPQVYLSKNTRSSISDDTRNRVGGIDGTYVKTNDFVNSGTKWGNGGVTYVEANTVRNETTTNLLSEISGDQTYINAVGNIENIGGRIKGNEVVALISENGKVVNDTAKRRIGYDNGRYDSSWHDEAASLGEISSNGTAYIKANEYTTTGGVLSTKNMIWDVNSLNANALKLSGEDRNGVDSDNYGRYSQTTHLGAGIVAETTSGRIGNMNLIGSTFAGGDTNGLAVSGNVNVESAVNSYENESKRTNKGFLSSDSRYVNAHEEENVAGNLQLNGARIEGNLTGIGSNIALGENSYVGGKVTTDSRELHNSYYEKNKNKGFNSGISHGRASVGYGKSQNTYDEKSTVNAKSNLQVGDGSVLNRGAEITATNFEYGNIQINNGDVKYGARIDTRDVHTSSKSSGFTISAGINSPIKDRIKQAAGAVSQIKDGDKVGGAMEAVNAAAGTVKGLSDNQGTRQTNYVNGSVGAKGAREAQANSNFYANIGVNAGFTHSRSNTSSHTEGASVTTLKPMDENSSITYSNVNNITYQGTQAQGGTFIYNNVANIQKEAVELHNSYSSSSSSRGINAGATIGYGHKIQTTGNGGSISASQSNQNTVETVYANGNFRNVNEVHNNTGSMVLNGFNQEGGKVTGNIGKVEVISRQNTSTTTGSSSGISLGISANGVPSSVNINGSRTNGNRAFVDNQSSFIVGEGSSLHVGTLENTGAVVGKEGNSTFKIDSYIGKDIQNHDTMKTTGGSVGISTGKPRITNIGFNQDSRDKQGITRNTVVGDVEIAGAEGSPINRDITRANEVTKDKQHSTNINVESQTIEYATNPAKLKEDIGKAKKEIADVKKAIKESIHDRGDDNRNFFGQLREVRLNETVNNIAGKRLNEADKSEDVVSAWKDAYKDLGYNLDVKYTTGEDTPEMKDKAGTAYVSKDGVHTIIININAEENSTKAGLIGTLAEEASHIVNGVAGRQIATGTEEKGLESTGRAANAYFKEEYKGSNQNMTYRSDGKIDTSKLGINVGDKIYLTLTSGDKVKIFDELVRNNNYDLNRFSEMTEANKSEIISALQLRTKDTLGRGKDENGNEIIIISNKYTGKYTSNLEKEDTEKMRRIIESKDKNILFKSYDHPDKSTLAATVNDDTKTYQTKNGVGTDNVLIRVNPNLKIKTGISFFEDTNNIYGENVSGKRLVTHETEHAFDFLEGTLDATLNKEKTALIPKLVPKDQIRYIYNKENNEYLKFIPTEYTQMRERKAIETENRFFRPRIVYFSGEYKIKKISKEEYEKVDKSKQEIFDTKGLGIIPKGEIENE